jgi:hypothetical protein
MPFDQRASEIQWHARPTDFAALKPLDIVSRPLFYGSPARTVLLAFPVGLLRAADTLPDPWAVLAGWLRDHPDLDHLRTPEAEPHRLLVLAGASLRPAYDKLWRLAAEGAAWNNDPLAAWIEDPQTPPTPKDVLPVLEALRASDANKVLADVPLRDRPEMVEAVEQLEDAERERVRKRGAAGRTPRSTAERLRGDLLPFVELTHSWVVFRGEPTATPFSLRTPARIAPVLGSIVNRPIRPEAVTLAIHRLKLRFALTASERFDPKSPF